ncbi:MAG TPA: GspH/FimT family pseudopilin [Candidatus Nitrosotenuis sp.]|nr:GspH/FimT family pseudopilin [Candidatus Nitrosotenuis sp.]
MRGHRAFSLTELLVVVAILGLLLGLVTIIGRRALATRELDASSRDLQAVLSFARMLAPNAGGARVDLVPPDGDQEGSYQVTASGRVQRQGRIPRGVELTLSPGSASRIDFAANGSVGEAITITIRSRLTGASRTLTVQAATGAVQLQ